MIVNKKALYALAAYYDACGSTMHPTDSDLDLLLDMFIGAIEDSFDMKTLKHTFHHLELFFKCSSCENAYNAYICDREIAKFLRYVGKHQKFPRHMSLHYV